MAEVQAVEIAAGKGGAVHPFGSNVERLGPLDHQSFLSRPAAARRVSMVARGTILLRM